MPRVGSPEWPVDGFRQQKLRLDLGKLVDQVWQEAARRASPEEHVRLRGVSYDLATRLFISGKIAARPSLEELEQVIAAARERFHGLWNEDRGIAEAVMGLLEGPPHPEHGGLPGPGHEPRRTDALSVNSVQQELQQRGRTTARMHGRRHRWLAAELVPTWRAPVVCIQVASRAGRFSGRTTMLDVAGLTLLARWLVSLRRVLGP
jgi:hypothetical protein